MKLVYVMTMAAALSVSATAFASDDGAALFKSNGCTNCHKVDGKSVGPSMKVVAEKYKGDAGAQAKLEAKVRSGGTGAFGSMPMPPTSSKVSDADIKTIVTWALSQH